MNTELPSIHAFLDDDDAIAIQAAITAGLDVNEPDESDSMRTPLMLAAREGGPHAVQLLLQAGARLDDTDDAGWSALHHLAAADNPNLQSLDLLLAAGADPDAEACVPIDEEEDAPEETEGDDPLATAETALVLAAAFGNDEVLARLLDAGGTPHLAQLRAAVSNGAGACAKRMMDAFPNATLGDVLAVWPDEPLEPEPRAAFEKALAQRDARTMARTLPDGKPSRRARGTARL